MGLKKRSKVSAEFSMSSLTDIIFLLLIFFMLTSSLVNPNALNLKLPGKSKSTPVTSNSKTPEVVIDGKGQFIFNRKPYSKNSIEKQLKRYSGKALMISPERTAPVEGVATIMDIAMRYNINAILAADDE